MTLPTQDNLELQKLISEFDDILKNDILANKYLTQDVINTPINKPLYSSLKTKVGEKPVITQVNQDWSYLIIRQLIHYYPTYEFWTFAHNYPNYLISTEGNVWSGYTKKLLKLGNKETMEKEDQYIRLGLYEKGEHDLVPLHVLILKSFLPENCHEFTIGNHKNGDKRDPKLANMEPSDSSHNNIHSQTVLGNNNFVKIYRTLVNVKVNDDDDNSDEDEIEDDAEDDIVCYNSVAEASRANNINDDTLLYSIKKNIQRNINGKLYVFSRDQPVREREVFHLTEENRHDFKEIGQLKRYNKSRILLTPNFLGYYISKKDGTIITYNKYKNRYEVLQPRYNKGYYYAHLRIKGKLHIIPIHRLVLIVHGSCPYVIYEGKQIWYWDLYADHIDNVKLNNSVMNLQWLTIKQNTEKSKTFKAYRLTYNGISTVIPSAYGLAQYGGFHFKKLQDGARINKKFLGNDAVEITSEEYEAEKKNNQFTLLFK